MAAAMVPAMGKKTKPSPSGRPGAREAGQSAECGGGVEAAEEDDRRDHHRGGSRPWRRIRRADGWIHVAAEEEEEIGDLGISPPLPHEISPAWVSPPNPEEKGEESAELPCYAARRRLPWFGRRQALSPPTSSPHCGRWPT
uniref:Uncharacterized protein n=1 Tax=Oryza nivara TaxID=4536 RepID=A0A0E0IGA5_ORYNI